MTLTRRGLWLALLSIGASACTASESDRPLAESDLIRLVELNIEEDAVLAKIRKSGLAFPVTDEGVERLSKAGASAAVLAAVKGGRTHRPSVPLRYDQVLDLVQLDIGEDAILSKLIASSTTLTLDAKQIEALQQAGASEKLLEVLQRNNVRPIQRAAASLTKTAGRRTISLAGSTWRPPSGKSGSEVTFHDDGTAHIRTATGAASTRWSQEGLTISVSIGGVPMSWFLDEQLLIGTFQPGENEPSEELRLADQPADVCIEAAGVANGQENWLANTTWASSLFTDESNQTITVSLRSNSSLTWTDSNAGRARTGEWKQSGAVLTIRVDEGTRAYFNFDRSTLIGYLCRLGGAAPESVVFFPAGEFGKGGTAASLPRTTTAPVPALGQDDLEAMLATLRAGEQAEGNGEPVARTGDSIQQDAPERPAILAAGQDDVTTLIAALNAGEPADRKAAAQQLGAMGPNARGAIEALAAVVGDRSATRQEVISASFGSAFSVGRADPVRVAAFKALLKIDKPATIAALRGAGACPLLSVQVWARKCIENMQGKPAAAVSSGPRFRSLGNVKTLGDVKQ